jgi:hypothetical protein
MRNILSIFLFLIFIVTESLAAQVQDDIGILSASDKQKIANITVPFDLEVLVTNFTPAGFENYFTNKGIVGIGINPINKTTSVVSPTGLDIKGLAKLANKDFSKLNYSDGVLKITKEYEKRLRKELMNNEMSQEAIWSLAAVVVALIFGLLIAILAAARKRRIKELKEAQEKETDRIIAEEFTYPNGTVTLFRKDVQKLSTDFGYLPKSEYINVQNVKPITSPVMITVPPPVEETTMSPMATLAMSIAGGFAGSMVGSTISNNFLNKQNPVEEDTTVPTLLTTVESYKDFNDTAATISTSTIDSSSGASSDTSTYSGGVSTDSSSSISSTDSTSW